ncbi:glycerol-3-phosphate dehydrogenase [Alteromonas sp. ASW11-130]|uniref:glycerol-3-phosphate dehydrogenase n=1 Tax=Alteromonas sp. ASW11-130 TaxID=3015775 RepID=UPI0022429357|nr:glycerol-3-phosphate dehydrogenase [Alteromonas sp. ASW11-130]
MRNSNAPAHFDLLVVGGGINGAGIAADAAGRGLSVVLCEKGDLGGATSSSSSKLIHGGLRYLEQREFKLVHAALKEREVLLGNAPHIMRPLRFRLPHQPHLRPVWMIRMGLFLYDRLAKRNHLPSSKRITCDETSPLVPTITTCFEYSDGWVDDARLVILNALAASQNGARILPRTPFLGAKKLQDHWLVTIRRPQTGEEKFITRAIVNAAGPWVLPTLDSLEGTSKKKTIRLVKGSHIVVPKLYASDEAYILQNEDQRIVFAIPFENAFSLIGTTDVDYTGDPADARISEAEKDYLINIINHYFRSKISKQDIVHTFSGVRPLLEEENSSAQTVTRDYRLELKGSRNHPLLLNVFGGKITTYRRLAEQAVNKLSKHFENIGSAWTASAPLPGGDFKDKAALQAEYRQRYPWLPGALSKEYVCRYGRLCETFLNHASSLQDLGVHFGHQLYQAEVNYLCQSEWAQTADDVLWRRTKKGLLFTKQEVARLNTYLATLMNYVNH